ncbi:C1 family peptidase [Duganella sp. HH101]|uniref:C1 family peptidase n=1 Tax=Duganella sp. HH101 TaxID=1781066 RepID=UPI0008933D7A|nr:C1 family peptidase [Duganella sp. HH101]OFA02568.1 hypothetical protein DUGA2_34170 [Duganella sp. HH101]
MSTISSHISLAQFSLPVFDQLDIGSCTANAVCQAVALQSHEYGQNIGPLARLALYYNTRTSGDPSQAYVDSGAAIWSAVDTAISKGLTSENFATQQGEGYAAKAVSDNWTKAPTQAMVNDAALHKVLSSTLVKTSSSLSTQQNHDLIGQQLMQGKVVLVGSNAPTWLNHVEYNDQGVHYSRPFQASSFNELADLHDKAMASNPEANAKSLGGHAFMIVGMDNTLFHGKGGYIIENSWGTSFGVNGFEVIPYDFINNAAEGFGTTTLEVLNGFNNVDQTWTAERGQISMLYACALNRAGEHQGTEYYANALRAGTTLKFIANELVNSAEGKALYTVNGAVMTNDQFIDKVFMDTRGRVGSATEHYWGNQYFAAGETRGDYVYDIMHDTAARTGLTTQAEYDFLMNRTTVSENFGVTYQANNNHLHDAQAALAGVTSNADTVEAALIGVQHALSIA